MAFPAHVLEIKKWFEDSEDLRFDIMCKLTEPREITDSDNYADLKDYEAMWYAIEKRSLPEELKDGDWVYGFSNAVMKASTMPPYYYVSKKDRSDLTEKIKKLSEQLIKTITANAFDAQIVLNNESLIEVNGTKGNIDGLYIYEDLCDIEQSFYDNEHTIFDKRRNKKGNLIGNDKIRDDKLISFIALIKFFADRSIERIKQADTRGKAGKNIHAVRFIRKLGQLNKSYYDKPLNKVLSIATFAIYGVEYSESDISKIQNR